MNRIFYLVVVLMLVFTSCYRRGDGQSSGLVGKRHKTTIADSEEYQQALNAVKQVEADLSDIKNASFVTDTSAGHKFPATYGKKLYSAGKVYNKRLGRDEYIVPVVYTFAKRLLIAQKQALKENYSILVYDAYRPTDVAKKSREDMLYLYNHYADVKKAVTYSYHNGVTYTWGWDWFIADGVSMHSYGVAVDVTLVSTKGKTVKMPTEFAVCDTSAIKYYRPIGKQSTVRTDLYASTMTQDAKNLDRIMLTGTGLSSLASEWWHFQDLASKNTIASIDPAGLHFHPTKIVSDKS